MSGIESVANALAVAYGWHDAELRRLPIGTAMVNYAGRAGGRQIFVEVYLPGMDLDTERMAIEVSQFAAAGRRAHGRGDPVVGRVADPSQRRNRLLGLGVCPG